MSTREILATDLNLPQMEDALWRRAKGLYAAEASVLLLTFHDYWLRRPEFVQAIQMDSEAPEELDGRYAAVMWERVLTRDGMLREEGLYGSGSAVTVLRFAASLDGAHEIHVGEGIASLDDSNLRLVLAALNHAGRGFDRTGPVAWPVRP